MGFLEFRVGKGDGNIFLKEIFKKIYVQYEDTGQVWSRLNG